MGNHDVFISYSSKNKNVADAIVGDFEQHGIKCWYAPRDILPGQKWVAAIREGLNASSVFILIYTEESNASRQVMNEVALAFNAGKTIVPFRLTEGEMNDELEYYLSRVHWLDALTKPLHKNIEALREYVEVILRKVPEEDAQKLSYHAHATVSTKKAGSRLPWILGAAALVLAVGIIAFLLGRGNAKNAGTSSEVTDNEDMPISGSSTSADVTGPAEPDITDEDSGIQAGGAEDGGGKDASLGKGGEIFCEKIGAYFTSVEYPQLTSFGSVYHRTEVSSITFYSELPDEEETGLDVSTAADRSVLAWYDENSGGTYDLKIAADGIIRFPADCTGMFLGYDNAVSVDFNDAVDLSAVESAAGMFAWCSALRSLDVSGFKDAAPTDFGYFLFECNALSEIKGLEMLNTSQALKMDSMFSGCESLKAVDVSGFDTSNCEVMSCMFDRCHSLETLDVSGFDTSKCTRMGAMFMDLSSLKTPLDLSGFDTSHVTTMVYMFKGYPLDTLDLSGFDTSDVTAMSGMFENVTNMPELDLSSFDFSQVEDARYMFQDSRDMKVCVDQEQPGWDAFSQLFGLLDNSENISFVQKVR